MAALAEKTLNKSTSQHLSPATRPSKSLSMEDTTSPRARAGSWDSVSTASGGFLPETKSKPASIKETSSRRLTVVIFGATGDLAKKKLYPALYQLMLLGQLPRGDKIRIVGFGRRAVELQGFIKKQCANVKKDARLLFEDFASRLFFHGGGAYDKAPGFESLATLLDELEQGLPTDRLFFLSVPPTVFGACAQHVSACCRAQAPKRWTRLIIEKPFGKDSDSFAELDASTSGSWSEDELFRIDHYLGKEVVLNLSTLRFANQLFEPTWNSRCIESVEITFKEDIGTQGRGGYFDGFGIIRDIMQNHLLQVLVLCAMEPPASDAPSDIQAAKVEVLKAMSIPSLDDAFLAQYTEDNFMSEPGYLEDPGVPDDSVTPTFAAIVLKINNERWKGVPFVMKAGKGLDERLAEVRVRYKSQPYNKLLVGPQAKNELVCRIQPDEALYLKTHTKKPGLEQEVEPTCMDMRYASTFGGSYLADAYERMFLNAAKGDSSLFVSSGELREAWRVFTPLLHAIDKTRPKPILYAFGERNPRGFRDWSLQHASVKQRQSFMETLSGLSGDAGALRAYFDRYDADKDGTLRADEIRDLARSLYAGRDPPENTLRKFFHLARGFDLKDKITFQDFTYFARCARIAHKSKPRAYERDVCSEK
jgi:glucose-6-phosphate 1-dehydrogenase